MGLDEALLPQHGPSGSTFIVLSRARSGTTWLLDMLNQHRDASDQLDIGCWGEMLLDDYDAGPRPPAELRRNLYDLSSRNVGAFYGDSMTWGLAEERAIFAKRRWQGFKWFIGHGGVDPAMRTRGRDWLDHPLGEPRAQNARQANQIFGRWLEEEQVRVVLLERSDLARYVSEEQMVAGHVDNCKQNDSTCAERLGKVTIDGERVRLNAQADALLWPRLRAFVAEHLPPGRTADLAYDELCREPQAQMERLHALLGVRPFRYNVSATYQKISGASTLRDSIANADEVVEWLKGTPWEGQVDAPLACRSSADLEA